MKKLKKKHKKKTRRRENFDSFIERTIKEIRANADFKDYRFKYTISKKDKYSNEGDRRLQASIEVDHRYLMAYLTIYPALKELYKKGDIMEIRMVLCHELAHIRTHKVYHYAVARYAGEKELKDEWESLTEYVGRLIYEKMASKK